MTTNDIDAIRPATDLLIANLRETVGQIQAHEHPERGGDLYCLNLTSYMGDRMGPVLRRLADEQAETRKWQEKHTALADEFTAEADRLNAKVAELTAERDDARDMANTARQEARQALHALDKARAVIEAAKTWRDWYAASPVRMQHLSDAEEALFAAVDALPTVNTDDKPCCHYRCQDNTTGVAS